LSFPRTAQTPWTRDVERRIENNERSLSQIQSRNNALQQANQANLSAVVDKTSAFREAAINGEGWYVYGDDVVPYANLLYNSGPLVANVEQPIYSSVLNKGIAINSAMYLGSYQFTVYTDNSSVQVKPIIRINGTSVFAEVGERWPFYNGSPMTGGATYNFLIPYSWYEDPYTPDSTLVLSVGIIASDNCNMIIPATLTSPFTRTLRFAGHVTGTEQQF